MASVLASIKGLKAAHRLVRLGLGGLVISLTFLPSAYSQMPPEPSSPPISPREAVDLQAPALGNDARYKSLETFARALYYLETMYVDADKVTPDATIAHALEGIVAKLDPHTVVMPPKAFEQLTNDTRGKFGGVGIIVSQEREALIIISAIEDTPAMRAGIKAGDEIIAINGTPLPKLDGKEAVDMMRGEPGSPLKLTIKRKEETSPREFTLIREIIKVESVRGLALSDDIYYIRISSFQESSSEDLNKLLVKFHSKMKGLVLDLRDNPGGLLEQSIKVADFFIESGLIVSTVGRDSDKIEREFAHKKDTFVGFPMIVMINEGSASASEIVAGALQDHQRALVLGTPSFGKGSVQTLVALPDGSGLKFTVARYFTPLDRSIQGKGIWPDIFVDKNPQDKAPANQLPKRESDLVGHIESQDLSNLSSEGGILQATKHWPEALKKDYQLMTAYTYVKGWSVFQPQKKL